MELIIASLIIFILVKEVMYFKERKDILDRLMAKNLPEYKDNAKEEQNDYGKEDKNVVELEDAKDELMYE
jgi:hypothetical protein